MRIGLTLLVLFVGLAAANASPRVEVKQGNEAAKHGLKDAALLHYKRALEAKGDTSLILYDLGNLLSESKDYDNAEKTYLGSLSPKTSRSDQSSTLYNLGNTYVGAGKYDKAVQAYVEALKRNPKDDDARHNLEVAQRFLRQQQQQKQQQQDQQNQKDDKDKKDDQKKDDQQQQKDQQQQQQNPQDQQQQQQQAEQDKKNDQEQQQQQLASGQKMSKDEAEKLLNALLQDEQDALKQVKKTKVQGKPKREKDW